MRSPRPIILPRLRASLLILAACAVVSACQSGAEAPSALESVAAPTSTPTATGMQPAGLIDAVNDFGFELVRRSRSADSPNTIVSPMAVHSVLSMTANGASGQTRTELLGTLRVAEFGDGGNAQWAGMLRALAPRAQEGRLVLGGALWARKGTEFRPAFVGSDQSFYGMQLATLDFTRTATTTVNDWYSAQSDGLVTQVVGELPSTASMVLTTGSHFESQWATPFDRSRTQERPFEVLGEQSLPVPSLASELPVAYLDTEDYSAVKLPYAQGDSAMYVMLPHRDMSVESLVATMDSRTLRAVIRDLSRAEASPRTIEIPKLNTVCRKSLSGALQTMGAPRAFDSQLAQFTSLAAPASSGGPLRIDAFEAATRLSIDEQGTGGAKTPAAPSNARQAKARFICNRPFLVAIVDEATQAVVLLGEIQDPRER